MSRRVAVLGTADAAQPVLEVLSALGHEGIAVEPGGDVVGRLRELAPDVVFHAHDDRSGRGQGLLELLGIPYTHSGVLATALAADRHQAKIVLRAAGVPVTDHLVVTRADAAQAHQMSPPYVVKAATAGLAPPPLVVLRARDDPPAALLDANWQAVGAVLVERYVPGRSVSVAVMGDVALGASEWLIEQGEDPSAAAKIQLVTPARISPNIYEKLQKISLEAHQVLGCRGVTEIGFRLDDRASGESGLVCLGVNTQPRLGARSPVPDQAHDAGHSLAESRGLDGGGRQLQQVSARAFVAAVAIDPEHLPALIPMPRRRAAANIGRIWVLHRRAVVRIAAAALILSGVGGIYEARTRLADLTDSLEQLGLRELAHSPLGISQISMSGLAITDERDVLAALHITPETSMVNFDADAARQAIEAMPSVASATVRKTYPNHIYVKVVERTPVARWRLNGVTYAIDDTGARITPDGDAFPDLPLVVGDAANEDAMVMTRAMSAYPALKKGLVALSRIGDRRWDMIYSSGVRVQLPELGVAQGLAQLATLEAKYQLLERDVEVIDLRVPGIVAVQPSAEAQKTLAAIYKADIAKNKVKLNQDSDYAAGH